MEENTILGFPVVKSNLLSLLMGEELFVTEPGRILVDCEEVEKRLDGITSRLEALEGKISRLEPQEPPQATVERCRCPCPPGYEHLRCRYDGRAYRKVDFDICLLSCSCVTCDHLRSIEHARPKFASDNVEVMEIV